MWIITLIFPDIYLKPQPPNNTEYFWITLPCVQTTCACKLCIHTDCWPGGLLQQLSELQTPLLKKPDCFCPARCQLTASQARACAAAACIPKHGQVTSVRTAVCWHHRHTTQGWESLQRLAQASGGRGTTMAWLAEWLRDRNAAWKKFLLRKRHE